MHTAGTARRRATGVVALIAAFTVVTPASAQEYCVACTGPQALYRCVLENATPTGIPLKVLCIKMLAREGGHATCSVRSGTIFECDAPIKRIDATTAAEVLSPSPVAGPRESGAAGIAPAVGFAPGVPSAPQPTGAPMPGQGRRDEPSPGPRPADRPDNPETVEGLAKNISRSTQETLVKAGKGITTTTRKTWDCVTSFFKSC